MKIGIAGVPGTGKTTVSEILSKRLGIPVIHQSDYFSGLVSLKAVRTKFWWLLQRYKDVIIEGHLLCDVKLPLDYLFILRTRPDVLMGRLEERGYSKEKIDENVLAEALDYCLQRAEERYDRIIQIDTTETSPELVAERIIRCINGDCQSDEVDWIPVLEKLIISGKITYI
ncbi:MAG: AAA family ATPase [Candidatus Diapherotrites archaeon]|nr:AAA family ATPase [Candidatus Diapherotrites archaeon]